MMSNTILPMPDWDMIHRCKTPKSIIRHTDLQSFLTLHVDKEILAFYELAIMQKSSSCLDAACKTGINTVYLTQQNLPILGSDISYEAVAKASQLAAYESKQTAFFTASWQELPAYIPHRFDAILCLPIMKEPEWNAIRKVAVGLFHSLNPCGFIAFTGPAEGTGKEAAMTKLHQQKEGQFINWHWREGNESCVCIVNRKRSSDYMDESYMYIRTCGESAWIESTTRRIPFYWTWKHVQEIMYNAGFCHVETRSFELPEGTCSLNVAWKGKSIQHKHSRDEQYLL